MKKFNNIFNTLITQKLWYIHTIEFCSATKNSEIMEFPQEQKELDIMQ